MDRRIFLTGLLASAAAPALPALPARAVASGGAIRLTMHEYSASNLALALLSEGEFEIPAATYRHYGPSLLRALSGTRIREA